MDSHVEKDWSEISRLRMEFAAQNPDIIEKLFQGDATALEAFTNFGGIKATVTSVIKRDISQWAADDMSAQRVNEILKLYCWDK